MSDASSTYHSVRSNPGTPTPPEDESQVEPVEAAPFYHVYWREGDYFWPGEMYSRRAVGTDGSMDLNPRSPSPESNSAAPVANSTVEVSAELVRNPFRLSTSLEKTWNYSQSSLNVECNDESPSRQHAVVVKKSAFKTTPSPEPQRYIDPDPPLSRRQFMSEPFGQFDAAAAKMAAQKPVWTPPPSFNASDQSLPLPKPLPPRPNTMGPEGYAEQCWGEPEDAAVAELEIDALEIVRQEGWGRRTLPLPWHRDHPDNIAQMQHIVYAYQAHQAQKAREASDQILDHWTPPPPAPPPYQPPRPLPQAPVVVSMEAKYFEREREQNAFTRHYEGVDGAANSSRTQKKKKKKEDSGARDEFKTYRHRDALEFAARSWCWSCDEQARLVTLPRHATTFELPTAPYLSSSQTPKAYYRVLAEKDDRYVLIACHVNLHAFHRGDLRFIEVNDQTELAGLQGHSVVGNLFLGDIVAVTKMSRLPGGPGVGCPLRAVSQDSRLVWMAEKMALVPRYFEKKVCFSFLANGKAIAKGFDEAMTVLRSEKQSADGIFTKNVLYEGTAFLPDKSMMPYTIDYPPASKQRIKRMAADIPAYPVATGTLFRFHKHSDDAMFSHGTTAFNPEVALEQELREKTVETCILMGYSAANTVFNGRFDARCFPIQEARQDGQLVKFFIANPASQPTEGMWNTKNRICLSGPTGDTTAAIESVVQENRCGSQPRLQIAARIARDTPQYLALDTGDYMVYQKEAPESFELDDGFFAQLDPFSNGRRIIETLYGAPPIPQTTPKHADRRFEFPGEPAVALNEYQNEYVRMILDANPMVLGSSPFGCGKSMTIITAALEIHKRKRESRRNAKVRMQQLLITQSNYASVNLVEIAKKATKSHEVKFVRFVSEENWKRLPDNCLTDYDLPKLMQQQFLLWASGGLPRSTTIQLNTWHKMNMMMFLDHYKMLDRRKPHPEVLEHLNAIGNPPRKPMFRILISAFFLIYEPDIIMSTADSSGVLLKANVLHNVCTIQIDEASQVPEYTIMNLLALFPSATFGLIGDIHQLPPYCEDALTGRLREYGIGHTMERALAGNLFPKAVLHYVYRCHPVTTRLLSELFYGGELITGVSEDDRNEFIRIRSDIWPNAHFPIMILNNPSTSAQMGTSTYNRREADIVQKLVKTLTKRVPGGYRLPPTDIGVISFYAAQTSVLTEALRGSGGVKCGTVDAFQGTEREVLIVCCTNERLSDFMQLGNRLNVALSRARQATIIIGCVDGMRGAKMYWSIIAETIQDNGCLIDALHYPF